MLFDALSTAVDLTGASMGHMQIREEAGLRIVAQLGFNRRFLDFFALVDDAGTACGRAMLTGRIVIVNDVARDPNLPEDARTVLLDSGVRAVQSAPLQKDGTVIGVMSLHYRVAGEPRAADQRLLRLLADRAARLYAP